jgi:hypothetical protein
MGLRALSVLVALLLAGSSLGQVAHFLLIPHAICAEHGEFLELTRPSIEVASTESASDAGRAQLTSSNVDTGHEHCQLMARREREQLLQGTAAPEILPAESRALAPVAPPVAASAEGISRWLVAPKTSPPAV